MANADALVSWGMDAGVVRGLCVGCAFGFGVNKLAKTIGPGDLVNSYPRWLWLTGSVYQIFLYPTFFFLAWGEKGFGLDWLQGTWTDYLQPGGGGMENEYLLIYALVGYMAKDLFSMRGDKLFMAHHLVSIFMTLAILYLPAGVGLALTGLVVLEFGTAFYGLKCMFPHKNAIVFTYLVMMTLSNITTVILIVWFYMLAPPSLYFKVFYAVFGTGLCIGRQQALMKDFATFVKSKKDA